MKASFAFAVLLLLFAAAGPVLAEGGLSHDDVVRDFETVTGLDISSSADQTKAPQSIWIPYDFADTSWDEKRIPVTIRFNSLLDTGCLNFGFCWEREPNGHTLGLDFPWPVIDSQPTADDKWNHHWRVRNERLQIVWKPNEVLSRQVPWIQPYRSFHEAIDQIEKVTGLKVSYPKEVAEITEKVWPSPGTHHASYDNEGFSLAAFKKAFSHKVAGPKNDIKSVDERLWRETQAPNAGADAEDRGFHFPATIEIREFLDRVCSDFGLCWRLTPGEHTVQVDIPWRTKDPRSVADLLQRVWKPGQKSLSKEEEQEAFDALLCKPENVEKAMPVRQLALLSQSFRMMMGGTRESLSIFRHKTAVVSMVAVSGDHYRCALELQNAGSPYEHGCLAYYWFADDGTLVGAGLSSTGHRTMVSTMLVDETGVAGPTQLRITVQSFNLGGFTAIMVLGDTGLTVQQIVGAPRVNAQRDLGFGEVLLKSPP